MALLQVQQIAKHFGERTLFSDVSFEIAPGDHIGLVGVNGCGKSTLLRILMGDEPADEGQVHRASECRMTWLMQRQPDGQGRTLMEETLQEFLPLMEMEKQLAGISEQLELHPDDALIRRQCRIQEEYQQRGGLTYRSRTRAVLLGLGFSEQALNQPADVLSGGELRKALLARVLLSESNLLLLDEPTNHLDIAAIEWLEEYLLSYRGAFLVVSHDRYFLDRVTTRTIEMEHGSILTSRGNYSRHLELKLDAREAAERKYYNQLREVRRIQGIIEQQRRWNQARNYVTIASKEKQLERIRKEMVKPAADPASIRFSFHAVEPAGNDVLLVRALKKSFGQRTLFQDADIHLLRGEHVCLLGANGCGKTTLLRILTGGEEPDAGSFQIGANVQIGYYEQSMRGLQPDYTVLEQASMLFPRLDQQQLRSALGQFLFRGDDVFKRIGDLSGGELARIQLLKLMLSGCNLLLLDEPTNHLDIPSREALERALSAYDGTMLIVTHDRYFVNRIADRILVLTPDGLTGFSGDWSAYSASLQEAGAAAQGEAETEAAKQPNAYQRKRELRSAIQRSRGVLKRAEERVAAQEALLSEYHARLSSPEIATDYAAAMRIAEEAAEAETALEQLYADWQQADDALRLLLEQEEE
ncbi:MAG: ABC-F family ATP-binding cassette domain-containing protein [bacterium]|nr:ABC-F family ATP-binding cassette domain-containing protein [bacterium]